MGAPVSEYQQHEFYKQDKISLGPNHMRCSDVSAGSTQRCGNCVPNQLINNFA